MKRSYESNYKILDPVFFFPSDLLEGANLSLLSEAIQRFCAGHKQELGRYLTNAAQSPDKRWLLDLPSWAYLAANCCEGPIRQRAVQGLKQQDATEAACLSDLAAVLIKAEIYGLAGGVLNIALKQPGQALFGIIVNQAVLASRQQGSDQVQGPERSGPDTAAGVEVLRVALSAALAGEQSGPFSLKSQFPFACRYLHALLQLRAPRELVGQCLMRILHTLDQHQPANRDTGIEFLAIECLPYAAEMADQLVVHASEAAAPRILEALARFCVSGQGDLAALEALDTAHEGHLCLTLKATLLEGRGDMAGERDIYLRLAERFPESLKIQARLAGAYYRLGELDRADQIAHHLAVQEPAYFATIRKTALANQALLDTAIAERLPERPADQDTYQDPDWAQRAWDRYDDSFRLFTRHQDIGVGINAFWTDAVEALLSSQPDIRTVFNFGSFNGFYDHALARQFPETDFVGFDRYADGIRLSEERYSAPNLRFLTEMDLAPLLVALQAEGPVVLCHIRTCTTLYPDGVRALYRACADAGVAYIMGVEAAGFSFTANALRPQDAPDRDPVVPLGIMVDHAYPGLLAQAGYRVVSRIVRPYGIPMEVRKCQGFMNVVTFTAQRVRSTAQT